MNSGTVDLIATDPPFNKGRDFHATPDSLASGASFQDRWTWKEDVHDDWVDKITDDFPKVMNVINGSRESYGDDMGAFLCFMGVRLLEMWRVLKPTGSMYLHCDPTASHYLKELSDSVFGKNNFHNEIIWSYRTGGSSKKTFSKKHDVILFYTKSNKYKFNPQKEKAYTKSKSRKPGIINYGKGFAEFFEDDDGVYNYVNMRDVWDIPYINSQSLERTGYPTQKPLELYENIIKASSNEGDVVLDPFAGCATTCVAAEKLKRKWIGIDIWNKAHKIVIERLKKEGCLAGPKDKRTDLIISEGSITYVKKPFKRKDEGNEAVPFMPTVMKEFDDREKDPYNNKEKKEILVMVHGKSCQGCGINLPDRYLELDHREPRSSGGSNKIINRGDYKLITP